MPTIARADRLGPIARTLATLAPILCPFASAVLIGPSLADEPRTVRVAAPEVVPKEALAIGRVVRPGRSPVHADPIESRIVAGRWTPPEPGDSIAMPDGSTREWKPVRAGDDGAFTDPAMAGGYLAATVPADADGVWMLEASGHDMVYVNGEPRAGDMYGYGFVKLPVLLRKGDNDLLFRAGRGPLRIGLSPSKSAAFVNPADATLPDLIVGQDAKTWGAVVVVNASDRPLEGAQIRATLAGRATATTPVPTVPPLGVRKVGFRLEAPAPAGEGDRELNILLVTKDGPPPGPVLTPLRVLRPGQTHKRTFLSEIDGSVQYFAVVPARGPTEGRPALILTLHGASVEGIGQANVYAPKDRAHVVAPTNRRPYGFDWEDWGRLDAIEVLDLAAKQLDTDPRRTYLTGHSMGGHGTWIVGATYPDRFAAIAPSAGWISMRSYAGARAIEATSPLLELLQRATSPSDTVALAPNYASLGVYVLHGDLDDNVPVGQAREMRRRLGEFHPDFAYYERPGAGHWWGNECCDWPPLIEFLARHERPGIEDVRRVDFVTASPGVSSRCDWAEVLTQVEPLKPSAIHLECDRAKRRFAGETENVARLALDLGHLESGEAVEIALDGQSLRAEAPSEAARLWLRRRDGTWSTTAEPPASDKGPHRYGPFKEAFRHRVVFVYGSKGTHEENARALAKARFDAETFWYRGNGSIDVVPDSAFDPTADRDRSVILYGNADTNAAWGPLLGEGPVAVRRGSVRVGEREVTGDDLACLFLRPRPGSDRATVGVVGGTGVVGMRLTDRLPYFVSGVGYPDVLVLGPDVLETAEGGVRATGYFGDDWGVASGAIRWRD